MFCGSNPGVDDRFLDAARRLGGALAQRGIRLVYGGASVGLMGAVADAVLAAGGQVVGVIPESLVRKEVAHPGVTELRVVASMHERKAMMAELSDAFLALPGGIGTLEELFEVWTWAQLGHHTKACGVLNVANFYDALFLFLDHMTASGFLKDSHRHMLRVSSSIHLLLDSLACFEPVVASKWSTATSA